MELNHNRKGALRRKYGMDTKKYERLLSDQNGLCVICEKFMKLPCVDHCHVTGRVRGLLCSNCNAMLGMSKDNPSTLRKAAEYLDRQSAWRDV